ncbi:Piso0 001816 protein [Trichuris trichiura]|uniref:Piso0 001816 protein n=1 Tax=Trichuris trichiura TaxID=36087 RepID=A0A077ZGD5_TRITR|nr:Piso0 001816 protein [Trichuris trichiura]
MPASGAHVFNPWGSIQRGSSGVKQCRHLLHGGTRDKAQNSAIDDKVMDIVNFDNELGGESFFDTVEDCGEPFIDEELEELMQPPKSSDEDDDVIEDREAQTPSD